MVHRTTLEALTAPSRITYWIIYENEQLQHEGQAIVHHEQPYVSQKTHDTIHFTVRVLVANQYRFCRDLKKFCTANNNTNDAQVYWQRAENYRNSKSEGKGKGPVTKHDQLLSIPETEVTRTEVRLLEQWLRAAGKWGTAKSRKVDPCMKPTRWNGLMPSDVQESSWIKFVDSEKLQYTV
jgi:hypothetical protein